MASYRSFSSATPTRSTASDDFVHLYGSPATGNPREAVNRILEFLQDDSAVWCTVLFRALRSLGRRVYYKYNRSDLYEQRYRGESLAHFAILAREAVKRLISSELQEMEPLSRFVDEAAIHLETVDKSRDLK